MLMSTMDSAKEEIHLHAYGFEILDTMNELRGEGSLCDVTIIVGGRQFQAHKLILCATSSYFKAMFTSGFEETNKSEVKIDGDGEIFEKLLEFIYTRKLRLRQELIPDIIQMASYFQITQALYSCKESLQDHLKSKTFSFDTVLQVSGIPGAMGTLAQDYLAENFVDFSQSPTFNTIPVAALESLLERNDLTALTKSLTEDHVLRAVTGWLSHDWDDRKMHAERLLRKVRLGVVPELFLVEQFTEQILSVPECKQLYEEVIQENLKMNEHHLDNQEMRKPRCITLLMRIASRDEGRLKTTYFQKESSSWQSVAAIDALPIASYILRDKRYVKDEPRQVDQVVSAGNHIYLNEDIAPAFRSFYWYNAYTNRWNLRGDEAVPLKDSAWVCIKRYLYAVGGRKSKDDPYRNVVQRFDTELGYWEQFPALPMPNDSAENIQEPVAIAFRGKLLVYTTLANKRGNRNRVIFVCFPSKTPFKSTWYCCPIKGEFDRATQVVRLVARGRECYMVCYMEEGRSLVYKLSFDFTKVPSTVKVGKQYVQKHLPPNGIGAFQLANRVYVNLNGFIYKLDMIVSEDEATSEELKKVLASFEEATHQADGEKQLPVFLKHTFYKFSSKLKLPRK